MKNLLDDIRSETMSFKSPIIVHNTTFPNGTTLKDKVEAKFNVIITDTAFEPTLKEMIYP